MEDSSAYYAPPQQPPPPGIMNSYPYYQPPPPLVPAASIPSPAALLPPQHPPHPHYLSHYTLPALPQHGSHDELRTLFIAGLPEDVMPREIYNLFREFPGYESSHITRKSQPFAFAVFLNQPSAVAAMRALNGLVFDLENGTPLYIDLAKSNSRSKRPRTDDERIFLDKRARVSPDQGTHLPEKAHFTHVLHPWALAGIGSTHMPGKGNSAYNTIGYPPPQSRGSTNSRRVTHEETMDKSSAPPCPTLFVANLGPRCTEQELIQVFSSCRGFLKLKMQNTFGASVAFVDFQDTACSSEALENLQGMVLYSSQPREGMRLEYAKSRMGMRRKPK